VATAEAEIIVSWDNAVPCESSWSVVYSSYCRFFFGKQAVWQYPVVPPQVEDAASDSELIATWQRWHVAKMALSAL
jgi:hypothetical protein